MNKNLFKKVVCLVIALMMMMPAMPSSLVSAAATETRTADIIYSNFTIDSTNNHSSVKAFWYDGGNLYFAFTVMNAKTPTSVTYTYDDNDIDTDPDVTKVVTGSDIKALTGTTTLKVNNRYSSVESKTFRTDDANHYFVIANLGNLTLENKFGIQIDVKGGGHEFDGTITLNHKIGKIVKVDQNMVPLQGSKFTVFNSIVPTPPNQIPANQGVSNNELNFFVLPNGNITIWEASAPNGYTGIQFPFTVKLNQTGTSLEFIGGNLNSDSVTIDGMTIMVKNYGSTVTINYESEDTNKGTVTPASETIATVTGVALGSTATAEPGYHFVNWTNAADEIVGTDPTFVPTKVNGLNVAATYTANFAEDNDVTINYVSADTDMGTVSSSSETIAPITGVALGSTATAESGYHFVNWTNAADEIVGTDPTFVPTKVNGLNVAATYTANFAEDNDVTINYVSADTDMGTVSSSSETIAPATGVALGSTATAESGYHFVNWTNAADEIVGTDPTFVPTKVNGLNVAATYTAHFAEDNDVTINYVSADTDMGTVSSSSETIAPATGVALGSTATAESGYHFVNWTNAADEIVGTDPTFVPTKVNGLNVAATYTANFAEDNDVTINYVSADTDMGTVSSSSETIAPITGVALGSTATAESGYHFVNWTNAADEIVGTDPTFVPTKVNGLNVAATYTANFAEDNDVTINYVSADTDMGTVSSSSETIAPATGVALGSTATAEPGYHFVNWTNAADEIVGTDPTFVPTKVNGLNVAATYTANFAEDNDVTINYVSADTDMGTVSSSSETIAPITGVALGSTATAESGYHFVNWTNAADEIVGTDPTFVPTKVNGLNVAATYTANFAEDNDVTINYVSADTDMGTVSSSSETIAPATGVTLGSTATAEPGYHFVNWTNAADEIVGTDPTFVPTKVNGLNVAATYTANFAEDNDVTINYVSADTDMGTVSSSSETIAPITGVALGSTATAEPGYHFVNWTNAADEIVGTDPTFVPTKVNGLNVAATYTANFASDTDTKFTVEHYLQKEDGTYPVIPNRIDDKQGTTGTTVYDDDYQDTFIGWIYTSDDVNSAVIVAGGSAVLRLYYTTETVEIPVAKIWIDGLEEPQYEQPMFRVQSIQRPESIELHLVDENGHVAATITIEPDEYNNWSGTFILPKYDGNNNVIDYSNYTIEEVTLDNYITEVQNWGMSDGFGVYNIEAVNVPVMKVWEGPEGNEVTVTLIDANGEPTNHTLKLNDKNEWHDSFKLPKYEHNPEYYWSWNEVDYTGYRLSESDIEGYTPDITGSVEDGFTVINTIDEVEYTINYLELGTGLPVAPTVTKSGIYGSNVTEVAKNIPGYNNVGQTEKSIRLEISGNVIDFYYSEYDIIESDFFKINWMYETGYNTNNYNKRYEAEGEGTVSNLTNYVQLHYDSGYTYSTYKQKVDMVEIPVVVDTTSGSAITGTAIKYVITTTFDLFYDRNRDDDDDDDDDDEDIPDPVVPLADLEKLDHFAYVIGYPEGDVRPLNNITREEVAMIFYRLLTDESRNNLLSDSNPFTDLENHGWSNRAISTLYNAGIIKGYPDGTFKPSDPISRAEFATIAAKFDKLELGSTSKFTDIFGHWAEKYITSSEIKGWIKGYPDLTFKPEQDITRAEAMTLINNVLERLVPEENIHPDAMFWPDSTSDKWYFEAVMEATNSHNYIYEEDGDELWTGLKANKVWP